MFHRLRAPLGRPVYRICVVGLVTVAIAVFPSGVQAQDSGRITGRVVAESTGDPMPGVTVELTGSGSRTTTDRDGYFRFERAPSGEVRLRAIAVGYAPEEHVLDVIAGSTTAARIEISVEAVDLPGIQVSVLQPDLAAGSILEAQAVREANPRDPAELLRRLPGVDAVRRGPIGLDPVVRGLRETQVASYVDGERRFPAGPGRMDSPLTHLDPLAIRTIEVVNGPYALTWGAGTMAAIRVNSQPLPPEQVGIAHGSVTAGYDSNVRGAAGSGSLAGRSGALSYWGFGAFRQGEDYEDGNGDRVPADFDAGEVRGKLGWNFSPRSRLLVSGGWRHQGPTDYPGRMLNAELFDSWSASGDWKWRREPGSTFRGLDVLVYGNSVDHEMTNRDKPTATLSDVRVVTNAEVAGGRVGAQLDPGGWDLEVGGDVYVTNRWAHRKIANRMTEMVMLEDLPWPDVRIAAGGFFFRGDREVGSRTTLSGTVRLDLVDARANADSVSEWFAQNVSTVTQTSETSVSAAFSARFVLGSHWTLTAGGGSVVRTADAMERWADRFPASKSQMSAEFVGSPELSPERSNQLDIAVEGSWSRGVFRVSGFARRIDEYITLTPTEFDPKMPMSPPTVFRYVNGSADFRGFEASGSWSIQRAWTLRLETDYLWGEDRSVGEPALGIAPWTGRIGLRWQQPAGRFHADGLLTVASDQTRIATVRGEIPTEGYVTGDLRFGWRFSDRFLLRFGAENVADAFYVNHLNQRNPFTGTPVPEPGRVFYANIGWSF
ncbi:MAG: TonB-dependent receptor [Gemmatimonadota bacterium]